MLAACSLRPVSTCHTQAGRAKADSVLTRPTCGPQVAFAVSPGRSLNCMGVWPTRDVLPKVSGL